MRVLSLFSGVGGFDMGLEAAGMTTVFQCEIDKHARSVLDYHWPDVPKWDDVSTLTGAHILEVTGGVDVVAWGSPCQDLSLAGKRAGLSGERSGLFHQGIRIIKELRELSNGTSPTWSVWENVVGALSSNGGSDFGEVLHEMDEAGACFSEWTVLDAQYFGVPQRRRRVFVTSCFDSATSERCGSPLFPVCESVSGDSAKGGKKKQGVARETADCVGAGGERNTTVFTPSAARKGGQVWEGVVPTLRAEAKQGDNTPHVIQDSVVGPLAARDYKGVGNQYVEENKLVIHDETQAISYDGYNQTIEEEIHRSWRIGRDSSDFIADLREPTLIVRRLTPLECERLMGWPDNHTAQGTNGAVSDTNRYKMCGNGIASPVAQWIAKHILATHPDAN
jgi:DNA (cytosine-5)-methyltransferase 1